jgi:hypothetical protein
MTFDCAFSGASKKYHTKVRLDWMRQGLYTHQADNKKNGMDIAFYYV